LVSVALFGLSMVGFGLSRDFFLSTALLACSGMVDTVSVVVRSTLLQVMTPDHLPGASRFGQRHFHRQFQRAWRVRIRRGRAPDRVLTLNTPSDRALAGNSAAQPIA
jgi:hypothetical protein